MGKFYTPTEGVESWRKLLAEPNKQWRTGYSARSLAYCWEEAQGFPKSVVDVFHSSPYELFHSVEFILGIPEHKFFTTYCHVGEYQHPVNNFLTGLRTPSLVCALRASLRLFKSVDESHPCDSPFRHPFGMSNFAPGEIVPADLSGLPR